MVISATFIGKDSLGYRHGATYKLLLTKLSIKVYNTREDGECEYESLGAFLRNWTNIVVLIPNR